MRDTDDRSSAHYGRYVCARRSALCSGFSVPLRPFVYCPRSLQPSHGRSEPALAAADPDEPVGSSLGKRPRILPESVAQHAATMRDHSHAHGRSPHAPIRLAQATEMGVACGVIQSARGMRQMRYLECRSPSSSHLLERKFRSAESRFRDIHLGYS